MKFGHCRGTKKEKRGASDWYKTIEAEHLARIDKEWAEREAAKPPAGTK
jgi:hypothetical protein